MSKEKGAAPPNGREAAAHEPSPARKLSEPRGAREAREARLAAALRANLIRRKAAQRKDA